MSETETSQERRARLRAERGVKSAGQRAAEAEAWRHTAAALKAAGLVRKAVLLNEAQARREATLAAHPERASWGRPARHRAGRCGS